MATSLQQQLAVIAANSTHQLDLKAQKAQHSKSLLFEPRDAATQNFETVYQLCLEGFDELCQLDTRFIPFARNLFSEQSKTEDRTTMTAKENSELDVVIERFLALLGGRLLLKPGMKAAEWMVRRFRVHEYNTQALLLTFLPYHAQAIFPTLLSILPEQLPPVFRFLNPYVSARQSPPRHAVVTAASNNPAFFTALSEYVLEAARTRYQSAMLLGFWASVTAQAVNGMVDATRSGRETIRKQKEEDVLLRVIPTLQKALGVKVPELYLGSCMIMTILACKASLSEKVLNAMMEAVAAGWTEQTIEDGLTCLAVLAEEKQHLHLPQKVVRAVLHRDDSLNIILRIGLKCRADRLLVGIAQGAITEIVEKRDPQAAQMLTSTLESGVLPRGHTVLVLEAAMRAIVDLPAAGQADNGRKELLAALSTFGEEDSGSKIIALAAKKSQLDLAQLDANLALQLEVAPESEEESDEDVQMLDTSAPSDPSLDLTVLPKLPSKDSSFLDTNNQQLFDSYLAAFQQALLSDQDLEALLNLQSLQRTTCEKRPAVLTFFARVWTSSVPNSTRLKALNITRGLLQEMKQGEHSVDMQALVPYLIAGLADPVKSIRSAAASTCLALNSLYESKSGKGKAAEDVRVWSKDIFYGTDSSKIQRLSAGDAQKFMSEALVPILEDCLIDANYIIETLADSINATSTNAHAERKDLKASIRTSVYGFLASHLVATPVQDVKLRLASILSKIGKIAGTARAHIILPYAREYLTQTVSTSSTTDIVALSRALISCLTHRSAEEVQLLKALANGEFGSDTRIELGFARLRQLWSAMRETAQFELVDWLVDLSLKANALEETQTEAVDALRNLSLPTQILVHLVERLPTVSELQGQPTSAKKQRTSRVSDVTKSSNISKDNINAAIRRITLVLELVEQSKPERHSQLLKGLFYFLSELHHYKILLNSELVYLQGLIITGLLDVVNGLKANANKDIDRSVIRADLIVECVRTTSSTQVHHASLLLMSALASWAPDLVLHSVMPLFTFMSSTILKQGDDYSAHVTDQTVARIIPPLAASLKKRGKDLISGAAELLLSFTAAFEHIPLHRRAGLFRHLVQTLGAGESLFAVVAMLVERYLDQTNVLPFVAELMGEFDVDVQLRAVSQYLDLVFDTLKPKRNLSDVILGYGEKDGEQAKMATSVLLDGLAEVLVRDALRKKLAKRLKKDDGSENLRITYSILLEKSMQLGLQLKSDETLHHSANRVLTSLLGLMPTKDFINASAMLMQSGSDEIRQQVFWSLEQRVKSAKRGDAALQTIFGETLSNCTIFVAESQPVATRTAAIKCIDNMAEKFGKTDRDAVKNAAEKIAGPAALGDSDHHLRRTSLLCLASMLEVLGDEFIPILPRTTNYAIQYLTAELEEDDADDERDHAMVTTCFSYALAVLDYVPWMLTGTYLDEFLVLSAKANNYHAKQFAELASKTVEAKDLFTSIQKTMDRVESLGRDSMGLHMETLLDAIKHHSKSTIAKNSQLLLGLLLEAFDIRRKLPPYSRLDPDDSDEDGDEESTPYDLVTSATMETVLKLNDATFRPFFTNLVSWAGSLQPASDYNGKRERYISVYSFALSLFDQLKSLVTSYAGFLLDSAAEILSATGIVTERILELNDLVLQTLTANFHHDQDGFWQSPAHFDMISPPILSLLSQPLKHNSEFLIPAITSLANAAGSPEHHKAMNASIMGLMRHEDHRVRLAAVRAERGLTEKLHVDWISLLPEMLPFISELQEDDSGEVEREVGRWIQQIEEVTGESLEGMLQ